MPDAMSDPRPAPLDRPVGRPAGRGPMRQPIARAVRASRVRGGSRAPGAPLALCGAPSPELTRLLRHLHTTVTHFVHARRAAGVAVDRVIPEVVCLVRESESCEGWRDRSERLMAQVVRWSIDAYHDAA